MLRTSNKQKRASSMVSFPSRYVKPKIKTSGDKVSNNTNNKLEEEAQVKVEKAKAPSLNIEILQ
jgi:hypothetical protein